MTKKVALVTGVTGQDGWHLSQRLLAEGYEVVGASRAPSGAQDRLGLPVEVVEWDLKDQGAFEALIRRVRPSEIYNLAAYSSGSGMYDDPVEMGEINGLAVARILEAIRTLDPTIRFCQASSSELFGDEPAESPQSESTPFQPRSPYGAAKLYGHAMVGIYRRRYGLFACSAILFNHESPRRTPEFVTRKISDAVARISLGLACELVLGALEARRDWGFTGDYMEAAWLMLQADTPDDYVIATGRSHSVREFCDLAFRHVGLDYCDYVREDPEAFRPPEKLPLVGNATKARGRLGWVPKVTFPELVGMMVDADLARLRAAVPEMGRDVQAD